MNKHALKMILLTGLLLIPVVGFAADGHAVMQKEPAVQGARKAAPDEAMKSRFGPKILRSRNDDPDSSASRKIGASTTKYKRFLDGEGKKKVH